MHKLKSHGKELRGQMRRGAGAAAPGISLDQGVNHIQSCQYANGGQIQPEVGTFDGRQYYATGAYVTGLKIWIRQWDGNPIVGGFQVFYSNGQSPVHGCNKTKQMTEFRLDRDERITKVDIRAGWLIDSLTFHTNKGATLGPFGGVGGNAASDVPPGGRSGHLAGISGTLVQTQGSQAITRISFTWACPPDQAFAMPPTATAPPHMHPQPHVPPPAYNNVPPAAPFQPPNPINHPYPGVPNPYPGVPNPYPNPGMPMPPQYAPMPQPGYSPHPAQPTYHESGVYAVASPNHQVLSNFDGRSHATGGAWISGMKLWIRRAEKPVIAGIKVTYSNGATVTFGGTHPKETPEFKLQPDEKINQLQIYLGAVMEGMAITTNKGRTFGPYGSTNGACVTEKPSMGTGALASFSGTMVKALGGQCFTNVKFCWLV